MKSGSGDIIRFWENNWLGEQMERFPRLFVNSKMGKWCEIG